MFGLMSNDTVRRDRLIITDTQLIFLQAAVFEDVN